MSFSTLRVAVSSIHKAFLLSWSLFTLIDISCQQAEPAPTPSVNDSSAVHITADETLYNITGNTPEALLTAMQRGGPHIGDTPFFGRTSWYVQWQLHYQPINEGCVMQQVDVWLNIETILPKWTPPSDAPQTLKHDWQTFYDRLENHEKAHFKNGVEAAEHIIAALRSMKAGSCSNLEATANKQAREIMNHYLEQERLYDEHTRHGATEGVVWPL